MSRRTTLSAFGFLMAITFSLLAFAPESAEEKMVNLNDFEWTIGKIRSEVSIERVIPGCRTLTRGTVEEFKSQEGPLSIVTIRLKSRKMGRLALIPELFLVRDSGVYGVYRLCQGIRVVEPKPKPGATAFHAPFDGKQWPGHAGWLPVAAGQSIVVELAFTHIVCRDADVLVASPAPTVQEPQ